MALATLLFVSIFLACLLGSLLITRSWECVAL